MINHLKLNNFRAFANETFRFKKLNIFIGKNNSGKSSALSALNVIAQTIQNQELDSSPLLLNGQFDKLGTYIDVVNGNNPRTKIGIEIGFDNYTLKTDFKYRSQRRQIELTNFELNEGGQSLFKFLQRKDAFDLSVRGNKIEDVHPRHQKRRPNLRNFWPERLFDPRDFSYEEKREESSFKLLRDVDFRMFRARRRLERVFENFDSLSPFRDQPKRIYLYSGETASRVGLTGSNMATMLAADSSRRGSLKKDFIGKISDWFSYTGIAKGISVVSLTPRHFEICLQSNDGSHHNICDVGFGCSQVLPVLVSGLNLFSETSSKRIGGTMIVQEPEIHLHPDAQAALGSFFASLINQKGQIFIETHSDNMVLRIATHVALGDISPDDVAIFFVEDTGDNRITEIKIEQNGAFTPDWPKGFFPQRQAESLRLAKAASGLNSTVLQQELNFSLPRDK